VQPSQKEHATGAVHCKKDGKLLQPLSVQGVECTMNHERHVQQE